MIIIIGSEKKQTCQSVSNKSQAEEVREKALQNPISAHYITFIL